MEAEVLEPQAELQQFRISEQMELTDRQKLSIRNNRRFGIDIEILDYNIIKITQARLLKGFLFNQKELYDRARKIFPNKEIKIIPVVYNLQLSDINEEWILEKMDELGIKRKDLIKQLGADSSYLSLLFADKSNPRKINLTRSMKATFYYYFMTYQLGREFRGYIKHVQQIPEEHK